MQNCPKINLKVYISNDLLPTGARCVCSRLAARMLFARVEAPSTRQEGSIAPRYQTCAKFAHISE
jgi:hypothetical protein